MLSAYCFYYNYYYYIYYYSRLPYFNPISTFPFSMSLPSVPPTAASPEQEEEEEAPYGFL
jgi:hypothetical protein